MRLTYSDIYSHENKYNFIGGSALNNLKKTFSQYSHKIIEIKERSLKHVAFDVKELKMYEKTNFCNF